MLSLNQKQLEKLKANWGARAQALACYAEIRVYDPLSNWECYLLAVNPNDDNELNCIISTNKWASPNVSDWTLDELNMLYNSAGESPVIDEEYRPVWAFELFKKLGKLNYDSFRD